MTTHLTTNSIFDKNRIENLIRRSLPYFFALLLFATLVAAMFGYVAHNSWKMGDWLINYQGGMIRRGLLGEVIYQLAHFTHINPGLYVVAFQMFFFATFFVFSFAMLKKQHSLLPYAFLIFSPFIFTFQINDLAGGFRKEIIFFALLAFTVWFATVKEHKAFEKIFYLTLFLYPVVILTHEMLIVFLPYLLVVYFSVTALTKKKFLIILLLLVPSICSILVTIYYAELTTSQIAEIFNSISRENYALQGGAITWLDKDAYYLKNHLIELMELYHYKYYLFIAVFSLVAYIPIYRKLKFITSNKVSLLLILMSLIGTAGLFVLAGDWGRWIYINLVSIFLLSLMNPQKIVESKKNASRQSINILTVVFFIIYALLWHIPHRGDPRAAYAQSFRTVNIASFPIPEVIQGVKSAYKRF